MTCFPTWCCKSIYTLDFSVLRHEHVKYIFTDLDNTLVPYNVSNPNQEVISLVQKIKNEGFNLIIVSNNNGNRVKTFAKDLDIDFISEAKKPFTKVIRKYLSRNNIDIKDCVLIGDQLMTDIKCSSKLKCKSILTNPLVKKESWVTFLNRKLDKHYRKKYNFESTCKKIDRSDIYE